MYYEAAAASGKAPGNPNIRTTLHVIAEALSPSIPDIWLVKTSSESLARLVDRKLDRVTAAVQRRRPLKPNTITNERRLLLQTQKRRLGMCVRLSEELDANKPRGSDVNSG